MALPIDPNAEFEKGPRATLPPNLPDVAPSTGEVLGAAFRQDNTLGSLYDAVNNAPANPKTVPGFDPSVSIPKGYEQNAEQFAEARSPEDMEAVRQRIDRQRQTQSIVNGAGLKGMAAELAAGALDPVTIASMFVPMAGETRLARVAEMALHGAATSAVQEMGLQASQPGRTMEDSVQNVASTAILSGVLGAFIRPHVPKGEFNAVADRVHADLHSDAETALGPIDGVQRIIPEGEVKPEAAHPESRMPAQAEQERLAGVHESIDEELSQQREGLVQGSADFVRGNDARAASRELTMHETALKNAQEAHANIEEPFTAPELKDAILERMENEDKQSYGEDYDNPRYAKMRERAATKEAREAAEHDKQQTEQQRSDAQQDIDTAQDRVDRQRQEVGRLEASEQAFKDLKKHDAAMEKAASPADRVKLIADEKARTALTKGLEPPEVKAEPVIPDVPQAITEKPAPELNINPTEASTVGAAAATPTMRGDAIAKGAGVLSNTIGRVSPGARLMNSASLVARQMIQHLANIPEMLTKNYGGTATASPIERNLWKMEGIHWQGKQARNQAFRDYRERMASDPKNAPISRKEFSQEISKAMRRNDQHSIPEVAKAAKDTRRIVFEPLKQRAVKLGLLPHDVTPEGADSYLMRQYDAQKIKGNMSSWLDTLTKGFTDQGADVAEARDLAHSVTRNVLGSERGTMDWKILDDVVPKSGQLKERTLKLRDETLEPFLNNDIDRLSHSYLRSMAPEVEMTERFGSRDMTGPKEGAPDGDYAPNLQDLKDDYARMMERATTDKEKEKLYGGMEADLRDLTAVRDRLYGIYGAPKDPGHFMVRAGRLLRSVNALRLLGAATLAHFPDVANMMMRYGMGNTFAAMGKVLSSREAFNLSRNEAKRMGAALDMTMNATASILGDYAQHSQYAEQRIANGLTSTFTMLTGETPLITAVQSLTSTMAQDSLLRTAQKLKAGQSVNKDLLARMAAAGVDTDMLGRFAAQHEQFGAKVNGLHFGMSDQWADKEAASVFESAILRDAHSVTLRPGVGDTPLFMSSEWGKALRQFTTFGYAAQRGVVNPLMQGLAHGDPRAVSAMFALASMGTLSYVSKQTAAGQPIEPFDSPKFALEVLDKSNLMGWTSDVVFPALWMMGMNNLSRWSDRDPVETLGGPVVGTVLSTYGKQLPAKFINSADNAYGDPDEPQKGVSRSDAHFIRRLMPGQNLWWARSHINDLEDSIADHFDLPGKSNADRAEIASNNP